jgi:hypothetical protein
MLQVWAQIARWTSKEEGTVEEDRAGLVGQIVCLIHNG